MSPIRKPGVSFRPMTSADATLLAPRIAAADPWHRLGIPETAIIAMLTDANNLGQLRLAIHLDGNPLTAQASRPESNPVGAMVIVQNWLLGPYLRHLSILEEARGHGIGATALLHLEQVARNRNQRNVWLCVSQFNDAAQSFYARHGFEAVSVLPDLVVTGETEILMRRQLPPGAA